MKQPKPSFKDRCIKDKNGVVTIGQKPNIPQTIGWIALLASWPLSGAMGHIVAVIAYAAWLLWALLELFTGVNYVRRVMGLVVLLFLGYLAIH